MLRRVVHPTVGIGRRWFAVFEEKEHFPMEYDGVCEIIVRRLPGAPKYVSYQAEDGTAKAGTNYIVRDDTLMFRAGSETASIEIGINQLEVFSGDLSFQLFLLNEKGEKLDTATISIVDDDMPGWNAVHRHQFPEFFSSMKKHFPKALPEMAFLGRAKALGESLGFTDENTIPMHSLCRDELTQPCLDKIGMLWRRRSFNIGSLAGLVTCGSTGLAAGMAHAPWEDDIQRTIFFVMPHIAIDEHGKVGRVARVGLKHSDACGALIGLRKQLKTSAESQGSDDPVAFDVTFDPNDLEMSSLKQNILHLGRIPYGVVPSLPELTRYAHECARRQLRGLLDKQQSDHHYMIFSGIQIHGPLRRNFVLPLSMEVNRGNGLEDVKSEFWKIDPTEELQAVVCKTASRVCGYVAAGSLEDVKRMAESGFDCNERDYGGRTPLFVAASLGKFDIVKYLVEEAGVDPLRLDTGSNITPERVAEKHGYAEIKDFLSGRGEPQ